MSHLHLQADPLDPRAVEARVAAPGCGAVVTFIGTVRDDAKGTERVVALEYEAWPQMAGPEFDRIAAELAREWPEARVAAVHRTGRVAVGEASIVISVAAPHRVEAFAACRACIDAVKARLPVWKREIRSDGGTSWVANAEFAPED